jgi:tetratricopeptide (TPR) repeat protein
VEHQRAAREQEIATERRLHDEALDREVQRILNEAGDLMEREKWPEALAAVERADKLLAAAGRTQRPPRLLELRKDLAMAERLEGIDAQPKKDLEARAIGSGSHGTKEALPKLPAWQQTYQEERQADAAFAQAFREYGIDIDALPTTEAAARIKRSSIRAALVKALDEWATLRRGGGYLAVINTGWPKLVEVARQADTDRWRNRCRQAVLHRDRQKLEQLADSVAIEQESPRTLWLLGLTLQEVGALDKAMSLLKRAQAQYPTDLWLNEILGHFSWNACSPRHTEDALRFYSIALALRPERMRTHRMLVDILGQKGALPEVLAEHSRFIALNPRNAWAWYHRGMTYGQWFQQYDKAIADFTEAIKLDPRDAWAWQARGQAYYYFKQYDKAIADYTEAIKLDPKMASAWDNRGRFYQYLKQYDKAIADYTEAIKLDPKNAWGAWNRRAEAFYHLHQYDKAIADYTEAIKLDPKHPSLWRSRANAYRELKQHDSARADNTMADNLELDSVNKAIEREGNSARAWINRGDVYRGQNQYGKALADYTRAIELDATISMAWSARGNVYTQLKQYDKAVADYTEAIKLDPKNAYVWRWRGDVYCQFKQYDKAIADYTEAIKLDPKDAWAWNNRGGVYDQLKQYDKAIPDFRQAIALDPRQGPFHDNLANACFRLGRWKDALAPIDKLAELGPNNYYRLSLAARLHLQTGDRAGYRRICREMLERFGDSTNPFVEVQVLMTCLLMPDADADRDRVLKLADRAVNGDIKNRWFLLCKALADYRAGRHAEAVQRLERLAPKPNRVWPSEASAFAVLAMAQHCQGRRKDALAALDQAESIAAKLPGDNWSDWLHSQALLGEAENLLKPDEALLHFYRGSRRGGQGQWAEADAEYRHAIRLRPDWYEAHYQLAVALWEQGRQQDAQAAFREARRLEPRPPEGRARSTLVTPWNNTGQWVVKDQEVHQLDERHSCWLLFGDPEWTDYDFEAEFEVIAGGSEVGLIFRATSRDNWLYAVLGASGNTWHGILGHSHTGANGIGGVKGQSEKGRWYRLRVEARRERVKMFLDGKLLMTADAGARLRGCVGLVTNPVRACFRSLKVTDATGKVLLEGVQDVLPKGQP